MKLSPMINDPLFRFLLGGMFIFIVHQAFSGFGENPTYRIALDDGQIQRLKSTWQKERGHVPTEENLKHLIRSEIMEEILYREAHRLGLAEGDRVIKRRLVQKYQFMLDDAVIVPEIDELTLKAHYQAHLEQYQVAGSISFEHLFFSNSSRIDPQGDAASAYVERKYGQPPQVNADNFPGPHCIKGLSEAAYS